MNPIIKILFVCHGNICRSPMAEFVMKEMVKNANLQERIYIESAATSTEELGNPVYPPARRIMTQHGIDCKNKTARQITRADYDNFDYIIASKKSFFRSSFFTIFYIKLYSFNN